ncbi:MAG: fimbrillin family protein [Tannerella sp.]|jgi:hypothetical protein|nr:fimbrillin family protein [Tannerella sp.]
MKKIYFLLSILLFASMSGCIYEKISEEETENPPGEEEKTVFRVNATVENTLLNKQSMASDEIGLYIYDDQRVIQNNMPVTLNGGYKEFDLTTNDTLGYCFAYYPYSSSFVSGTTYSGTLPPVQNQEVSNSSSVSDLPVSISNQLLMISDHSSEVNFKNQIANIQFKNIFSLFCFKITKDATLTQFNGQRLKRFQLYASTASDTLTPLARYPLSGSYTIDIKNIKYPTSLIPQFSSFSSTIQMEVTNSPAITSNANTPVVIWAVVPPPIDLVFNKLVVRMETEDDNHISYSTISAFHRLGMIERNTLTTLDVNLTKNNVYSDDIVKESFVDKPANSYVVSERGVYEIAAKKISGESFPDADSVDWLWASKAGGGNTFAIDELVSNISFDAATIRFRVGSGFERPLTEGNVVLALKDASNTILWTWHIWITDKPKDLNYGGKIFIDRNIGALSADTLAPAVDTYGFVYQWGRKDPFIGGDGLTVDEATNVLSVARAHTIVNPSAAWKANVKGWSPADRTEYGTVEQAVNHPMTFIYNSNSSSEQDPADWLFVSDRTLWSDQEKTDADPCPYGYKTPGKDDMSILYSAYRNYRPSPLPTIWFYNRSNSNRYWEYSIQEKVAIWPVAGMRQGRHDSGRWIGGQLKYAGTNNYMGHGYYWTSTPWDEAGNTVVPGASYNIMTRDHILYENTTYGPNADAYPVRCVKMTNP